MTTRVIPLQAGSLAGEIKKRRPFESAEQEAYLNLCRTYTELSESFDKLFRQHGLCSTHYNVLRILAGEAEAGGPGLPALEVRERLITRVPDITRLVDKLEDQGLVKRVRTESDRRMVLLEITPKGQELIAKLGGPVQEIHRRQMGHLTGEELATLTRLLEKARNTPA